ncbi:MAG: hypothetical protein K2X38_17130 [Gemmataceae bacterium]|nr:hypothetical protein [Gemmataceae bacterium]
MNRWIASLAACLMTWAAASAHFVYVIPEKNAPQKSIVVFTDTLEPDEAVAIEKIDKLTLNVLDKAGKTSKVELKKQDHSLAVAKAEGAVVLYGSVPYGVLQKGKTNPYLLSYHAKRVFGPVRFVAPVEGAVFEIVGRPEGKFRVLYQGKPVAKSEVAAITPKGKEKGVTDDSGDFSLDCTEPGVYGLRAKHIDAKPGELDGKKYDETRHYATLVFEVSVPSKSASAVPAMPQGFSSFGAAALDGYVYVYGGHTGKSHTYSTETVTGKFRRINIAAPTKWEELGEGAPIQGLALVAVDGKIVRIGGMQPRNKTGESADNHSIKEVSAYEPKTGKWSALPELPAGRSSHDAVAVGSKIVVAGGWEMQGKGQKAVWHDKALVLDLSKTNPTWETIDQPFSRRAVNVAAVGTKVFVVGGMTADGGIEKKVDVLDLATGKWSGGPNLPGIKRNGFAPAACTVGNTVFVSPSDGSVYRLNEKQDGWNDVVDLEVKRMVHRIVPLPGNRLMVIGGAGEGGNVSAVQIVDASATSAVSRP